MSRSDAELSKIGHAELVKAWEALGTYRALPGVRRRILSSTPISNHRKPRRLDILECGHEVEIKQGLGLPTFRDCPLCWHQRMRDILAEVTRDGATQSEASARLGLSQTVISLSVRYIRSHFSIWSLRTCPRPRTPAEFARVGAFYGVAPEVIRKVVEFGLPESKDDWEDEDKDTENLVDRTSLGPSLRLQRE